MQVATVGIDLAKNIFHVHCVDQAVHVIFSKPLRRAQMGEFFVKTGSDHDFGSRFRVHRTPQNARAACPTPPPGQAGCAPRRT